VGEPGASAFFDRVAPHRETLRRYALRLSGSPSDADDLVQATMERALGAESLPADDTLGRWLMVTLYRLFIDQCRKRKAESKAYEGIRHISSGVTAERPTELPRWMRVTDEQLRDAVAKLPDRLRVPYVLRARGKSYKEIAEAMEVGINTVSTRIHRARSALRETLSEDLAE